MTTPPPPAQQPAHTDADTMRHLRVLEERFVNLRRKAQLADEKLLSAEQKMGSELRSLSQELVDLRRSVADVQESIGLMKAELSHAASVYDLKALEKYVEYWEPLQFVTKDELIRKQNLLKGRTGR
jgi:hypothetical protein